MSRSNRSDVPAMITESRKKRIIEDMNRRVVMNITLIPADITVTPRKMQVGTMPSGGKRMRLTMKRKMTLLDRPNVLEMQEKIMGGLAELELRTNMMEN